MMHKTVLLNEAIDALFVRENGIYVDCTFGCGGHSNKILSKLNKYGRLISFDKDKNSIKIANNTIQDNRFEIIHKNFGEIHKSLLDRKIQFISGMLLDLGLSSLQINDKNRGFSFYLDGILDMRMDTTSGESAAQWLSKTTLKELTEVIKNYGQEKNYRSIAKAIFEYQKNAKRLGKNIKTIELANIISNIKRNKKKGRNPATQTFQAIRIHINEELNELKKVLNSTLSILEPGGKIVVISFHSLEDKIVKEFFKKNIKIPKLNYYMPTNFMKLEYPFFKTCKKIFPSRDEIYSNPRARSAIMRVAERNIL